MKEHDKAYNQLSTIARRLVVLARAVVAESNVSLPAAEQIIHKETNNAFIYLYELLEAQ